jgi:hypothetical protein
MNPVSQIKNYSGEWGTFKTLKYPIELAGYLSTFVHPEQV